MVGRIRSISYHYMDIHRNDSSPFEDSRLILIVMSNWIYLILAIISDVIATSSLKSTEGFTKLWPSIIVLLGYSAAFYFLSLTLDTIPIGVVYAIWSGVGIAAIAVVSVIFFDQKLDTASYIGMGLIIAGVVVLRLYSDASVE